MSNSFHMNFKVLQYFCINFFWLEGLLIGEIVVGIIGGLQPISRDTDNNGKMYNAGGRTKGANEKSIVLVHQHGRDDVTENHL